MTLDFNCNEWYLQKIYWKEKFISNRKYKFRIYFSKQEKYIAVQRYSDIKKKYDDFFYHTKFHKFTNLRYLKRWCDSWKPGKGE